MAVVLESRIRPFTLDDLPAVADLWQRAFRQSDRPASPAVRDCFREIFLNNPWIDPDLPSLVYRGGRGQIAGFLGVIPRTMLFDGRAIRVAVATQLMVDKNNGFAATELIRHLFSGPQDLCYSDGCNDCSSLLWTRLGGQVLKLYSLEWTRTLRPAESLVGRMVSLSRIPPITRSLLPLSRIADAFQRVLPRRLSQVPRVDPTLERHEASLEVIRDCIERFSAGSRLRPDHDLYVLGWLLHQLGRARAFGDLRKIVVRNQYGCPLGCFIYYANPGSVAQVLYLDGERETIPRILNCLFADAFSMGATAISGGADPRYLPQFAQAHCRIQCPGAGVVVHSRDPDLLLAMHSGNASISRLDGEWWLRLGIDRRLSW